MSEPIGWNVYSGPCTDPHGDGDRCSFVEFIPNEAALAAESARLADEVERRLEDGTL